MTPDETEARAKSRFFILATLRLFGALLMVAGFVLVGARQDFIGPDADRIVGVILVLVGAFDFAVAPTLLARHWKRGQP
jgi:drug/metabolite transporter (DMT)-like permease